MLARKDIEIVKDTTGRVEVSMRLLNEIQRFIRKDTRASIETEGLVGNKVVMLEIGSSTADQIGEGGTIHLKIRWLWCSYSRNSGNYGLYKRDD